MRPDTWLDDPVLRFVAEHRIWWLDHGTRGVMAVGTSLAVMGVVAVLAAAVVVARRAYRPAVGALVAFVVATVVASLLKAVIGRARPPAQLALVHLTGPSMPSTHAARTAAAAAALLIAVPWRSIRTKRIWTVLLVTTVGVIGFCLVYLGVHWPTDVLVGWALGLAIGVGCGLLMRPSTALPDSAEAVAQVT